MNNPKQLTFPWNKPFKSSLKSFYVDPRNDQLLKNIKDLSFNDNLYIYGVKILVKPIYFNLYAMNIVKIKNLRYSSL